MQCKKGHMLAAAALGMFCIAGQAVQAAEPPNPAPLAAGHLAADQAGAGQHLQAARQAFAGGDRSRAAHELRRAAAALHRLAREDGGDPAALKREARALEATARDVAGGQVATAAVLDQRLGAAEATLASHHLGRSTAAWARSEYAAAGTALSSAAQHLEQGLHQAGVKVEEDMLRAAAFARELAAKGRAVAAADYERARSAIGAGIASLERATHARAAG